MSFRPSRRTRTSFSVEFEWHPPWSVTRILATWSQLLCCSKGVSLSVRSKSWAAVVNICVVSFNGVSNAIQSLPVVGVAEVLLTAKPHDLGLLLAAGLVLTGSPWNTLYQLVFQCMSIAQILERLIDRSSPSTSTHQFVVLLLS